MLWIFLLSLFGSGNAVNPLRSYNVNPELVTVSGLSSGGAFATQIHVALSETIKGAAIFAGIPYYCAKGNLIWATYCMTIPSFVDVNDLIDQADQYSAAGSIDDTSNMAGQRVAIWHGDNDFTVNPGASDMIEEFYQNYGAQIGYEILENAGHCMPTEDYGTACSLTISPYINDCDYNGAYRALNWLYRGNLTLPDSGIIINELIEFDQEQFAGESDYFDPAGGYAYVPTDCADGAECALHVAFHGCLQGRDEVGDVFARNAGYLEVAEANNIIVIFPQIIGDELFGDNPNGCYDWWGFEDFDYATRNGAQVSAIKNMIDFVLGF